jgi:HSP20 family protein
MSSLYFDFPWMGELDEVHRQLDRAFGSTGLSSLRAQRRGSFPALNIGSTDTAVEVVAFLPGVDPSKLELTIDKGVLSLSGERTGAVVDSASQHYAQERFSGRFRRTVELPQNVDASKVDARYTDGCLHITVGKELPSTPKSISIQRGE